MVYTDAQGDVIETRRQPLFDITDGQTFRIVVPGPVSSQPYERFQWKLEEIVVYNYGADEYVYRVERGDQTG